MQRMTGPPQNGPLYDEMLEYDTLEAAYEAAFLYLEGVPDSTEEWLINLQNHLIWHSYDPGEDPDMDCVVLSAVSILLERHGIKARDIEDPELRRIIDILTLN